MKIMIECSCNKTNEMLPLFETEKSKQVEKIYFNDKSRKLLGSTNVKNHLQM